MSYRIDYQKRRGSKAVNVRCPFFTAICFLLFLLLVKVFWPEGMVQIHGMIRFVKESVGVSALDSFAAELLGTTKVIDAFSDFLLMLKS